MAYRRRFPTRGMQIGAIIVVAAAALAQVYWPLSSSKKAEKLYMEAWFTGGTCLNDSPESRKVVGMLDEALKLSPDNSRYEQALVWLYPRKNLLKLLEGRKLSKRAEALGYRLIADDPVLNGHLPEGVRGKGRALTYADIYGPVYQPEKEAAIKLPGYVDLVKRDPDNALAHYLYASILSQAGRREEAIREVRAGNRAPENRTYMPELSPALLHTHRVYGIVGPDFRDNAELRQLARNLTDMGNRLLQAGLVDQAREVLEECCRMGVRKACVEHATLIDYLVGTAVFDMGWTNLEPIYKDYGMGERFHALIPVAQEFPRAVGEMREQRHARSYGYERRLTPLVLAWAIGLSAGLSAAVLVLVLLRWTIWRIAKRRKAFETPEVNAWGEGWLARLFIAVYAPALALSTLLLIVSVRGASDLFLPPYFEYESALRLPAVLVPAILAQIVVLGLALRRMRRAYNADSDFPVSKWRFIFGDQGGMRRWISRRLSAVLLAQIVFLGCCFVLLMVLSRQVQGGYPWQWERIRTESVARDIQETAKLDARLLKACPPDWRVRRTAEEERTPL